MPFTNKNALIILFIAEFTLLPMIGFTQISTPEVKFSLEKFEPHMKENLEIHYDDFQRVFTQKSAHDPKEEWIEYKTTYHGYYTTSDEIYGTRPIFFTLLENVISEDSSVFSLLKFLPYNQIENTKDYSYFHLIDFTGTIYGFDETGTLDYFIGVTDGKVMDVIDPGEH